MIGFRYSYGNTVANATQPFSWFGPHIHASGLLPATTKLYRMQDIFAVNASQDSQLVPVDLVDETDGETAEVSVTSPTIEISTCPET